MAMPPKSNDPKSVQDYLGRYPRVLTRITATGKLDSIEEAAVILRDAVERRKNYSQWVLIEHKGDALGAVMTALSKTPSA
jgi:hypothetical protein